MELDDFLSRLDGVRRLPSGISARCPAHHDQVASLTVNPGNNGGVAVYCHANCDTRDVVAAMGLTMADLMGRPAITATYPYCDEDGHELYRINRWVNPKRFVVEPAGLSEAQRVPFDLPALAKARIDGSTVWIFEGEKDALRGKTLGLVATTNPFGAGKWLEHYSPYVAGCPVIIVADNDPAGHAHARDVARSVAAHAAGVSIVRARYGKDFSEMLDLGWTLDALETLPEPNELSSVVAINVAIKPITWLWNGYFPMAKVAIVEGDPGASKSALTIDLIARFTSGQKMPDATAHSGPHPVVLITAEDDVADTIAPRLKAAGADLRLVHLIDHGSDPAKPFIIGTDMPALYRMVMSTGAKLVVLDPLSAFLGDRVDSHNDASVRAGLYPLYRMAGDTGAAVLVVRHLNKGSGAKAIYRGGGSIGFIGAARAAYTVGQDPEDPNRRIMACTKMNIAPAPPSLGYSVLSGHYGPYLEWHGIVDTNAQQLVDGESSADSREMIDFLNRVVGKEPMTWREIVGLGRDEAGWTEAKLRNRRGQSRLIKIIGDEGNRSTRWGYLDHRTHLLKDEPISAIYPQMSLLTDPTELANGPDLPTPSASLARTFGESGRQMDPLQQMEGVDADLEEDRRDRELDALDSVCQVCGAVGNVFRWGYPYWVVRCVNHNPHTYGGVDAN